MLVSETHRDLEDGGERLHVASLLFQETVNLWPVRVLVAKLLPRGCTVKFF